MALDRAKIVKVALELLDEVGFDRLSTRAIADRLGIKGPSLYWHFASRRELLDAMAEVVLAREMPSARSRPGQWAAWLAEGARAIRRAANSHRDGARLLAGAKPTQSRAAEFMTMIARLEGEGFAARDARAALMALGRYALGWVLDEQMARAPPAASDADFEFGLSAMVGGLDAVRAQRLRLKEEERGA
jgi:TetR/AcrR family transcriptional regulator, tetracycline repressor protein